ncbi:MAG: hypothetical protein SFU27_08825 [Thermonemataceae bacterium]|nr:hypothetical protein [Thermonemataceae bacterium]
MYLKVFYLIFISQFTIFLPKTGGREVIDFRLKNDLAVTVNIETEKATLSIESNAVYHFEKPLGEKLYILNKNQPKKLVMIVSEVHRGKTINISELL